MSVQSAADIRRFVPDSDYQENRYASAMEEQLRSGDYWLDLGAGTRVHGGWDTVSEAELAKRARLLIGCDLSKDHMRRNRHLHVAVVAAATHLPFRNGSINMLSANMVVEHLQEPEAVLGEVSRVLAQEGRFVFSTPNRRHPIVWLAALLVWKHGRQLLAERIEGRDGEHVFPTFYRFNTGTGIRRGAARAGFAVRSLELFNSFPFFRRPRLALLIEGLLIRATNLVALRGLRSNIVCCLEKR